MVGRKSRKAESRRALAGGMFRAPAPSTFQPFGLSAFRVGATSHADSGLNQPGSSKE